MVVWQHIVLMDVVTGAGRHMNLRNDVHKHDMLPHHLNEVFYWLFQHFKYFSKELHVLPDDDRYIKTCRSFLNVLMCVLE
jgi:hypothetical protein